MKAGIYFSPYTLHPTPYTLHPSSLPYTLHPSSLPYTLLPYPTPYTLHPSFLRGAIVGRVAVLKFGDRDDRDPRRGFAVSLQVWEDRGGFAVEQIEARLPERSELDGLYISWQTNFRKLIKPNRNHRQGEEDWHIDESLPPQTSTRDDVYACRQGLRLLEASMKEWLQSQGEDWQKIREKLVELARDGGFRILVQAKDTRLWQWPWYAWDLLEKYPNVGIGFSLPEFQKPPLLEKPSPQHDKIRILAVLGDSSNIDIEADREVLEGLEGLDAETEFLQQPTSRELIGKLRSEPGWSILFFAGHSQTIEDTGRIYINRTESVEVEEFKHALQDAIALGLKLAIFNSCQGLSLARELVNLRIPAAIAMKESVPDKVAQSFLRKFIGKYASGQPLYLSARKAAETLEEFKDLPGCTGLPVICQNPAEVPPTWQDLQAPLKPVTLKPAPSEPVPPKPARSLWRNIAASGLVAIAAIGIRLTGVLQPWELSAYDRFMQQRPVEPIDSRLLVVEVTKEDVKKYDGYPLSDETVARALATIERGQPRGIGLDMHRTQGIDPGRDRLLERFNQNPHLFIVCEFNGDETNYALAENLSDKQKKYQVGFSDLILDELSTMSRLTTRRHLLSYHPKRLPNLKGCTTPYSFSFLLAFRYLAVEGVKPSVTNNKEWQFGSVVFKRLAARTGGYQYLDGLSNQILINYRAGQPKPAQKVNLRDILDEEEFNSEIKDKIKDKIVLVGYTADDARDEFQTPYGEMQGIWVHAHLVSQMLAAVLDDRPLIWVLPQWGDAIFIFVWAVAGGLAIAIIRPWYGVLVAATATLILYVFCWIAFSAGGWMPLVPSALALAGSAIVCYFIRPSQHP